MGRNLHRYRGGSGGSVTCSTRSSDFTAATGFMYLVTTGSGTVTATLPDATTNTNEIVILKKVDGGAGTLVVSPVGGQTIDGGGFAISMQWQYLGVISDGANWQIYTRN